MQEGRSAPTGRMIGEEFAGDTFRAGLASAQSGAGSASRRQVGRDHELDIADPLAVGLSRAAITAKGVERVAVVRHLAPVGIIQQAELPWEPIRGGRNGLADD